MYAKPKSNFKLNKTQYDWFSGKIKIQRSSIPKIRKILASFGSYRSKTHKTVILAKNGQSFVINDQNFAISEFFRHIVYDFLKEDHKNNFQPKIRKIHSGVWKL